MHLGSRSRKRLGLVALFVALAVVPVLALNSLATADTSTEPPAGPSASQQQCLAGHGVTVPAPGSRGTGTPPSAEQRDARRDAGRACGLVPGPPPGTAPGSGTI